MLKTTLHRFGLVGDILNIVVMVLLCIGGLVIGGWSLAGITFIAWYIVMDGHDSIHILLHHKEIEATRAKQEEVERNTFYKDSENNPTLR